MRRTSRCAAKDVPEDEKSAGHKCNMTKKQSKFLAFLLRHGAAEIGLELDAQGWASVDDIVGIMQKKKPGFNSDDLKYIVETDSKGRFEIKHNRIRARYGHSIKIEPHGTPSKPPEILYHGTARRNLGLILSQGLKPMRRQYVHLSINIEEHIKLVGGMQRMWQFLKFAQLTHTPRELNLFVSLTHILQGGFRPSLLKWWNSIISRIFTPQIILLLDWLMLQDYVPCSWS